MVILGVLLLVLTPVLLMAALAVRFAGNGRALNSIDYATIADRPGLHRWAGHRLLVLPACSGVFGVLALQRPVLGLLGGVVLAGIAVWVWIAVGADRFRGAGASALR